MMNSIKNFISKLFTRTRTTQAELNEQFLAAAKRGDTATVSALLAAPGILVNQADNFGLTALMYAARHGHTATVTALLAAPGILVNQTNNYAWTALIQAVDNNHTATVTALLAAPGILVNQADNFELTALMRAAMLGHTATVTALLANPDILVNQANGDGRTALMLAARNGHAASVTALLAAPGILINQANNNGWTALMYAAMQGHTATVTALLAAPGILVNQADNRGETALMWAARMGHAATVTALLNAPGIDVNLASRYGETAITQAFENGHHDIVTLLQARGAVLPAHLRQENRAANNINRNQSVHEISVHVSVSRSAKNLVEHFQLTPEQLIEQTTELFTWLSADFSDTANLPAEYNPEWLAPARNCFVRLNDLDFTDQRSGVRMQEALALVWAGINNTQARGADQPALSQEEITNRRINLLKNLYEIHRGYNLTDGATPQDNGGDDRPTCLSGSFNKLIAALSEVGHVGVQIIFVTPALINMQVPFLTKQAFGALSEEYRARFAQNWENEDSEELQAECFELLKKIVSKKLHETYDEFHLEVRDLAQVINNAVASAQYTDMDAVMHSERENIQKKEQEAQAERERLAAAAAAIAPTPAVRQQGAAAVVFSCHTRGTKRSREAVVVNSAAELEEAANIAAVGRYP
jgi:ankyrin repeat protein